MLLVTRSTSMQMVLKFKDKFDKYGEGDNI